MKNNDENRKPTSEEIDDFSEIEDWDLPHIITEDDDDYPEILENIEPEEAIETIITNIHMSTIITIILGIVLGILFYIAKRMLPDIIPDWLIVLFSFIAGLLLAFGASEIIILGVKGVQDKLNMNPYLAGIFSSIGTTLADLVIVGILLIRSYQTINSDLAITAITLILTAVIINILFLGLSIIFMSKDEPKVLPDELTLYEANLTLGMMVFTFVILLYGLFYNITDVVQFEESVFGRWVEIIIGAAVFFVYIIFIIILVRKFGRKTSSPQSLISEFFPEQDEIIIEEPTTDIVQLRMLSKPDTITKASVKGKEVLELDTNDKTKSKLSRHDALATLRRFPWVIIIFLFLVGVGGVIWGADMIASGIENGLNVLDTYNIKISILAYSVIIGIGTSIPELTVTFRGLTNPEKDIQQIGLVNQVSTINQAFFILFGFSFLFSGVIGLGIPIKPEITFVMGGIFIMSTAELLMIIDDNRFDILEGVVITTLAIVCLLALALFEGFEPETEITNLALQISHVKTLL